MGVRDAHPEMHGTHALRGFLSRLARVSTISNRSCFQSFTPAERELMRVGAGTSGRKFPRQRRSLG
ncbi:hypothetical protein UCMB321_0206 [Pseudomonas batumici]|uniref:Uncharacterized protein n=1 Tax=Pseudomonas batumici TaxID=226910 RepID=A0A0C2EIG0_9PSED|nr:hypothetical protein UCMB321_0206 [Pseudomonas batumici]